jgi:hypothetical protein
MRSRFHHLTDPPARRRGPTTVAAVVLAAVVAASLAGCGGDPEPTPTPTPSATATPSPTPTPTPSPTVPVPTGRDPAWTEDQWAAVQQVEAFWVLHVKIRQDPDNWEHWTEIPYILGEPFLSNFSATMAGHRDAARARYSQDAAAIPVGWSFGPVQESDGRKEIEVSVCRFYVGGSIEDDGQTTEFPQERKLETNTVQFRPEVGWRVIDSEGGLDPC